MSIATDIIKLQIESENKVPENSRVRLRDYLDYHMASLIKIDPINVKCIGEFWINNLDEDSLDTYVKRVSIDMKNGEHILELKDNKYKVGDRVLKCLLKTEPDILKDVLEVYLGTKVMVYPFKDLITTNYLLEKGAAALLNLKVKYCEYDKTHDILRVDVGFISR